MDKKEISLIAIDGPAASGKSTVGRLLAERLNFLYLDTGSMYRAVTWAVLERAIEVDDEAAVSEVANTLNIEVTTDGPNDGRQYTVLADGQDVTWDIRRADVDTHVSQVSAYPGVRKALTAQQRRIASSGSIVMVGRDIGTVVLPDAHLKIFMEASPQERARRRYQDIVDQGQPANYEEILAAILERDEQDRNKPGAPMVPAEDAIIIKTDNLSLEAVVAKLQKLVSRASSNGDD